MGIIHRDIKPENVLIVPGTGAARVRITDFTNAWLAPGDMPEEWQRNYDVEPGAPLEVWRTYSKNCIGTKEYIAPEIRSQDWYGPMVDWWAFGCLVYDLLVGDVSRFAALRVQGS
jgi:serine/threonine protein kinase